MSIKFACTPLYAWVERGTMRVKCLAQEHNTMSPARTRTRTTPSRVKHTNHAATVPLCHLCSTVKPLLSILFGYPDFFLWSQFFSWILISCDLENSKSQKHILLKDCWNSVLSRVLFKICKCDWLNCFVAKGISCLSSSFCVGDVNTRAIDHKLKSKTCLRSESKPFYRLKISQIIISGLDKGEKGTNLAQEFVISKQQISDMRKNKDKILKFTDSSETSKGLKGKSLKLVDDEQ